MAEEIAANAAAGTGPDMVIMCDNGAVAGFAHDGVIMPLDDVLKSIGSGHERYHPVVAGTWT